VTHAESFAGSLRAAALDALGGRNAAPGLVFVAFGKSLAAFEAQLKRMAGRGRERPTRCLRYAPGDVCVFLVSAGEERAARSARDRL